MNFCTIDGVAHFGRWLLRCKVEREVEITHHVTDEGIICYTEKERERAERWLKDKGIEYKAEELPINPILEEKAEGIKYTSRSEALAHLAEDREPESEKINRLIRRVEAAEEELTRIKQREMAGD